MALLTCCPSSLGRGTRCFGPQPLPIRQTLPPAPTARTSARGSFATLSSARTRPENKRSATSIRTAPQSTQPNRRSLLAAPVLLSSIPWLQALPAWGSGASDVSAGGSVSSFATFPGGLKLLSLRTGTGEPASPEVGDEVDINFTGRLFSKQGWYFENTYNQKGPDGFPVPFTFTVGDQAVIAGLSEAVQHMRKGEIARAVVPPALSYRDRSQGPVPREWSNRRRLYSVVFNEVRQANGEGCGHAGTADDGDASAVPAWRIRKGTAEDAECEATVSRAVESVNESYLFGEAGLWKEGMFERTNPAEVRALLTEQKLLLAVVGSEVAGSVAVEVAAGNGFGEIGMLNVAREHRRAGVGLRLITAAEAYCRERGCTQARLFLLTPREGTHPFKVVLDRWYTGLGYTKGGRQDFGAQFPEMQPMLARDCDLVEYRKAL